MSDEKKERREAWLKDYLESQTRKITREAKKHGFLIELDPDTDVGQTLLKLDAETYQMRKEVRRLTEVTETLTETLTANKKREMALLKADKRTMGIAASICRILKEENLTYREMLETLAVCEEIFKEKCVLGD